MNKTGDWATQVKQRVHFDRGLGRAKIRPRKQREAQINGRAVERINRIGQIKAERVIGIQPPRPPDQNGSDVRPYAPIAPPVRAIPCRTVLMVAPQDWLQYRASSRDTSFVRRP